VNAVKDWQVNNRRMSCGWCCWCRKNIKFRKKTTTRKTRNCDSAEKQRWSADGVRLLHLLQVIHFPLSLLVCWHILALCPPLCRFSPGGKKI